MLTIAIEGIIDLLRLPELEAANVLDTFNIMESSQVFWRSLGSVEKKKLIILLEMWECVN